jgi:hypothetical protein
MHTLAVLLAMTLPAQAGSVPNLDFSQGKLTHWEGKGFVPGPAKGSGPSLHFGVCSSDGGTHGRTGLLHRTFVIPPGVAAIHFTAAAIRPDGCKPAGTLDIVLEAPGREYLPRLVRNPEGWKPAPALLPALKGQAREYLWPVASHTGRRVRIALIDADDRPGCHIRCSGFRFIAADDLNAQLFAAHMERIQKANRLPRLRRLDSKHFLAISSASEDYTELRLYNCETIHALFFAHFRRRGFAVREPDSKMMVAIFDSQKGFEAYLGRTMPTSVTGIYHTASNRLVVYDYGQNRDLLDVKKRGEDLVRRSRTDLERGRLITAFDRHVRDRRNDTNLSTIMHEVAHQLSFNCGLLNRQGDAPLWLIEGLACYCEPTINGAWQGIGGPNPQRARSLMGPANGRGAFIPLRDLVRTDDWLRKANRVDQILLGYAQSWALFRMLMEQQPRQLRRYLELIYPRRTPDHRLTDFGQAFGADLARLERNYQAYMQRIVRQEVRSK